MSGHVSKKRIEKYNFGLCMHTKSGEKRLVAEVETVAVKIIAVGLCGAPPYGYICVCATHIHTHIYIYIYELKDF